MLKRNWDIVFTLAFIAALCLGCPKKETPGPTPDPTPVVEPTAVPDPNVATCYVPVPAGSPPFCNNAKGDHVACPEDEKTLPVCGDQ